MNKIYENDMRFVPLLNFYNKYKTLILASIAFLIIIIFSIIALSVISKINNQKASLVFNAWSIQEIESEEGLKKSNELFEDLTTSYSRTGYAKLAILTKASSDAKNGKRQNAIMGFSKLVKLTNGINGNKLYNKLARVSAARLLFANANYDEALIMIEKYSSSSTNAYIHELTGDILMKKDSISLAKEQYQIAKEKYIDEARRIRETHSGNFLITFNDNTYFNDGPVSEESYYSFYNLALEVLEKFDQTVIYLKPKRSNHFKRYIKNNRRLGKYIDEGRLNLLISDHSRSKVPPAFPALFSDLVIGLGLSTTTMESTISGALSFNIINEMVFKHNEFYKKGLNKIVFNNKETAIKAIDKVIAHKDNDDYLESLEHYKILDSFLDQNAKTRISKALLEIAGSKQIIS